MAMEKFHFKTTNGEITLPWQEDMPVKLVRKNRHLPQDEQVWEFIEAIADEKTISLIDELTLGQFRDLVEAWSNKSETNLGESSAS